MWVGPVHNPDSDVQASSQAQAKLASDRPENKVSLSSTHTSHCKCNITENLRFEFWCASYSRPSSDCLSKSWIYYLVTCNESSGSNSSEIFKWVMLEMSIYYFYFYFLKYVHCIHLQLTMNISYLGIRFYTFLHLYLFISSINSNVQEMIFLVEVYYCHHHLAAVILGLQCYTMNNAVIFNWVWDGYGLSLLSVWAGVLAKSPVERSASPRLSDVHHLFDQKPKWILIFFNKKSSLFW